MDQTELGELTLLLVFGIGGMLILAIGIISFFVVYQRRILVQQKKFLQLETEQQKLLLASIISAQEEERGRIASDLHDSVGSLLSATSLYLKKLQSGIADSDMLYIRSESLFLLNETILNIRNITHNLLPQNLERFGLIPALEDLLKRVQEATGFQIDFSSNTSTRFNNDVELAIYRVVQELLNNTVKHADAKEVKIQINLLDKVLNVDYLDNGKGFDHANIGKNTGLGLINIESRVKTLNGSINYKSEVGEGVEVQLKVPIL